MPRPPCVQVRHFGQLYHTQRFQLFDYGSAAANRAAYGQDTPPDVGRNYKYLRGIPVSIFAGVHDGIIPPENTRAHYADMAAAGVQVHYQEVSSGLWEWVLLFVEDDVFVVKAMLASKPHLLASKPHLYHHPCVPCSCPLGQSVWLPVVDLLAL